MAEEFNSVALENCEFENLQNIKTNRTVSHFRPTKILIKGTKSGIVQVKSHQKL